MHSEGNKKALKIDSGMTQKYSQLWNFAKSLVQIQEAILSFCKKTFFKVIKYMIYKKCIKFRVLTYSVFTIWNKEYNVK